MNNRPVVLFGEAERGSFGLAYYFESLPELADHLGNPPPESRGLVCAVQILLSRRHLIFFRVKEEGYSFQDYFLGLRLLQKSSAQLDLAAICLPGVGDAEIIDAVSSVCELCSSLIIISQPDLYDYLTYRKVA